MKIYIWGHKLHTSTHSYIHAAYFKTFEYLGYETYWIDSNDNLSHYDFSNSIFFVEGGDIRYAEGIPLRKDCKYITHHIKTEYFTNAGVPFENILKLGNYLPKFDIHENVGDLAYWDESIRCLYQPWATDLLPHEIDEKNPIKFSWENKKLNFIGMLHTEAPWWAQEFANIIYNKHNVEFKVYTQNASFEENRKLIEKSFLCPDFRGDWHLECGYLSCRIFKNISYGRIVGTNSPNIKNIFGDYVVFGGTPNTLYNNLLDSEINQKVNMRDAMLFVKEKHTYINRVNNILKLL